MRAVHTCLALAVSLVILGGRALAEEVPPVDAAADDAGADAGIPTDAAAAPPAVVPPAAPAVAPPASITPTAAPAPVPASAPLAGFTGDVAFLRSADDSFVLLPGGRLQIDGLWSHRTGGGSSSPYDGFSAKRARLELGGWIGGMVFFIIAGDFSASPPASGQGQISGTDNYIAVAPFGDLVVFQAGQFNVPFTLENRTSDKYTDFVERSLTVRNLGVPAVRDQGIMLQGLLPRRSAHYSLAMINGDGQNFRNQDNSFDFVGRAWIAPFALVSQGWADQWSRITVGGSAWTGRHPNGLTLPAHTTLGGFTYLSPKWTAVRGGAQVPMELRQYGRLRAWALELDAPLTHRIGVRAEVVWRHQQLVDVEAAAPSRIWSNATLDGWSAYGLASVWILGDDRILPVPGLQLPQRVPSWTASAPPRHGLQAVGRFEVLRDHLVSAPGQSIDDPAEPTTRAWSLQLGANYWYSKRFRATLDYALYHFWGTARAVRSLPDNVHELLGRLAIAL